MSIEDLRVIVFGATGAVGRMFLKILADMGVSEVQAVASHTSTGRRVGFGEERFLSVQAPDKIDYRKADFCLMSVDDDTSKAWAKQVADAGCVVIDNSAYWRLREGIPLIVPEVNGDKVRGRLIASPNCVVIPLVVALGPLQKKFGIKRVVVSTYQSTSGAGDAAMGELLSQTKAFFMNAPPEKKVFPKRISFNVLPQIGLLDENGVSGEEAKIMAEVGKIMATDIPISVASARVPTLIGHGMSVNVECQKSVSPEAARALWEDIEAVLVVDRQDGSGYVTPAEAANTDPIYISRIRRDVSVAHGLNFWVVCDNLRKGAALNAVQIMQRMVS